MTWAVVVVQLVERSLQAPENRGLKPRHRQNFCTNLSSNCVIEKTKIKKKKAVMARLLNNMIIRVTLIALFSFFQRSVFASTLHLGHSCFYGVARKHRISTFFIGLL